MVNFFRDEAYPVSEPRNMGLSELETKIDSGDIIVPNYQRNFVWSTKQQQAYLKSFSQGFPLFGPVINVDMDTGVLEIMDGQNRLLTLYNFMKDKVSYISSENGKKQEFRFSEMSDNHKRRFRNKRFTYLETQSWTDEDCQEFFITMNGGGVKLKPGELIHADQTNIFTQLLKDFSQKYDNFITSVASNGGLGITKSNMDRYVHYEFIGTLFHMVRTAEFPLRPGKTAEAEMVLWRGRVKDELFTKSMEDVTMLLDLYKGIIEHVPRLNQKLSLNNHLRLLYFLFKKKIHLCNHVDVGLYAKIDHILTTVLNRDTPEYNEIIQWGTTDCMKIYEKYDEIYRS